MFIKNLQKNGFVSVPYPSKLRLAVMKAERSWEAFCSLPIEVKRKFSYSNSGAGVGYEIKDGSGQNGDIKENFDIALSDVVWLESCMLSLTENTLVARKFVEDALALVEVMKPFVFRFASEVEKGFGLNGFEAEIEEGSRFFFVRFIHYPPQKKKGESIAQAHLDQSGMTFHFFESSPGLECLTYEGRWIPMSVSKKQTVIIPDMQLQLKSKGKLRALWHRVVATTKTAKQGRYSAVSFIQFQKTQKYNKEKYGRLQEKEPGFNYDMRPEEFSGLFKK